MNKFLNKKALIAISSILVALSITIIYITLIQSNKYNYDETIQQDLERELNLATESKKITMDDIKEYLKEEVKGDPDLKVLSFVEFKGTDGFYTLVEYKYSPINSADSNNFFRLYSMDTGEHLIMPTFGIIEIEEIINENEICFINNTGEDSETNRIFFPYRLRCVRENKESEFESIMEDLFLDIETPFRFGNTKSGISDIKICSDSIEIFFDVKFVAGYVNIPPADISYNKDEEQMVIVFNRCNTEFDLSTLPDSESSRFIKSINLENIDNKCILKIALESAKKYNMKERVESGKLTDPTTVLLTITFKG
ncbi:MAG TPA: hypothetical protein VFD00_01385 [Thermoclostridium sp.]|nr:hypothetical protein [Thermoclostridium sp.]